jgi:hypothetical protein
MKKSNALSVVLIGPKDGDCLNARNPRSLDKHIWLVKYRALEEFSAIQIRILQRAASL